MAGLLRVVARLSLGILLIAVASAILLIADLGRRSSGPGKVSRIAIVQHANTPVLDEGIEGLLDGLAERGFRDGENITIQRFNAQGDMPTGVAIARQVTAGDFDLVVTSSTPSMQAVANNNREGKTRHVFFLVADPYASGIGLDRADPLKHPAHIVGQGVMAPVEESFRIAKESLPSLQTIGVAWNPSESNSLVFTTKAREATKKLGLTLVEANVDSTSAVPEAINSLVSRGAQAIWIGGDNTVIAAVDLVASLARRARVPVFTILPGRADRGTLFDIGPNFFESGRQAAFLVADVLEGADISKIPIRDVLDIVPPFLSVNTTALKGLRERWAFADATLKRATVTVDEAGVHGAKKAAPAPRQVAAKKWRLGFVEYNNTPDVEESEAGVLAGLKEAGLEPGRDFEYTVRNAQGDMATVTGLIDAAIGDGADMLVTFSTPTLQAAIQRTKTMPIVFTYVANAFSVGAGTTNADHLPNVSGVYMMGAFDKMLSLVREVMPRARKLGMVYVPAEVNMVHQRDALMAAAGPMGFEIKSVAANSSVEVADAAMALATSGIDAICQVAGNLTVTAFPGIAQAASRAKLPVFVFQSAQLRAGGVLAVSRDYHGSGVEAGRIAAQIIRGARPATIPFVEYAPTKLMVNLDVARKIGFTVPQAVIRRADEVIGR
ncbi:MAG: ABC transporter substrate-binding protein [Acidobacteria bacterium]|nr:ABC transporter substrate-binding protein [Acidobacteriota bacterium]